MGTQGSGVVIVFWGGCAACFPFSISFLALGSIYLPLNLYHDANEIRNLNLKLKSNVREAVRKKHQSRPSRNVTSSTVESTGQSIRHNFLLLYTVLAYSNTVCLHVKSINIEPVATKLAVGVRKASANQNISQVPVDDHTTINRHFSNLSIPIETKSLLSLKESPLVKFKFLP